MSYYGGRGDYYRGVGDPGIFNFLGHAIGSVAKIGLGAGLGFLGGGPKGAIVGAATASGRATRAGIERETLAAGGSATAFTPALRARHAQALMRGSAVPAARALHGHVVRVRGFGGRRRMNVANVKALHRSVRRLAGFEKLYSKVMVSLHKLARKHGGPRARAHAPVGVHRGGKTPLLLQHGDYYEG